MLRWWFGDGGGGGLVASGKTSSCHTLKASSGSVYSNVVTATMAGAAPAKRLVSIAATSLYPILYHRFAIPSVRRARLENCLVNCEE